MEIKRSGRSPRYFPRGTTAIASWIIATATTAGSVAEAILLGPTVLAVGGAVGATILYARKRNEASTQAAFMAGVIHERDTHDSEQLPTFGGGVGRVVHLPDQRGNRPKPRPRHSA